MSQATPSIRTPAAPPQVRSEPIRAAMTAANTELSTLQAREREMIGSSARPAHLREIAGQIQAVRSRLAGLNEQLIVAAELDQEAAFRSAEDDFLGHLAVAKKHIQGREAIGLKLTAAFVHIGALLQELDDANENAWRHLHVASRELPRQQHLNLVHEVRRVLTGGYATHALLKALLASGVGVKGINAPVVFDAGGDAVPTETFEQALARSTAHLERQLSKWVSAARGQG